MGHITIEPWSDADFPLLEAANAPEMTEHLFGPETDDQVRTRHARYLDGQRTGTATMFTIRLDGEPVGGIGYWQDEREGEQIYETGWNVLTEFQGHGYAAEALRLVIEHAREHGHRDTIRAFPSPDHAASNGVARSGGMELIGLVDGEYPKGNPVVSNHWVKRLRE